MRAPRLGSLFSGYGGLDLAIEEFFGAETVWHCQYDPEDPHQYAAAILARHWPAVPNLGDITAVNWDRIEPVDIVAGGFPCTDVSLAGQRAGLNDQTRSGLWAHMARAIAVLRPKLVIIENVRGLLSAPADRGVEPGTASVDPATGRPLTLRALGAVLGDLAGLGFDAEWCGVRASDVGAPHERFRVFIIAWPSHPEGPRLEVGWIRRLAAGGGPAASNADQLGAHRPGALRTGRIQPADGGGIAASDPDRDSVRVEPVTERRRVGAAVAELVGAGAPADAEIGRLAGLSSLPAERDAVRERQGGADAPRCGAADADASGLGRGPAEPDVQPREPDVGRRAPADATSDGRQQRWTEPARLLGGSDVAVGCAPDWGAFEPAIRRWEHIVGRPAPWPVDDRGRLSPALPEWMQGLAAGWLTADPIPAGMTPSKVRNAQLKAAGNGVVPQQALAALEMLWERATTSHVDQEARP